MARSEKPSSLDIMDTLRWAYRALFVLAILAGGLYLFHETEQFLISDPRFVFGAEDASAFDAGWV